MLFDPHVLSGIFILGLVTGVLSSRFMRTPSAARYPVYGWVGVGVIVTAEICLFAHVHWVSIYFTPIVWTGYLLVADGTVKQLCGASRITTTPRGFAALAFWSIPLWLIFEAYNLRLRNWTYVGVPANPALAIVGYGWSFATIWPAIFETADFFEAMGFFSGRSAPRSRAPRRVRATLVVWGLLFVLLPVLVPAASGRYLFAFVWVGFIPLLDPITYILGGRSLLREWEMGRVGLTGRFLFAGLFCGLLWEFWNYWALARWEYIFPIGQGWKIFAMPLPGYLGFAPFGLECFVMYEFLRAVFNRIFEKQKREVEAIGQPEDRAREQTMLPCAEPREAASY